MNGTSSIFVVEINAQMVIADVVLNDKNVKHGQSDVSAAARCVTSPAPIVIIISPA